MWHVARLLGQFLSHQQMLFYKYNSEPPRDVLGQLIKPACSPWLWVAKGFSQHFLCPRGWALIGCEWCHDTVYFSWWKQGLECGKCVYTALGNRETVHTGLKPCCTHLLWAYDVATQWNTHHLCVFCYLQLLEVSVYLGFFLSDALSKFSIWALLLTSCVFPQTQSKLLGTIWNEIYG